MRRMFASIALAVLAGCPRGKEPPRPAANIDRGTCAPAVREPVLPADMVEDLGTLAVGFQAAFAVSAGTSSFLIFSQEAGDSAAESILAAGVALPNAVVPTKLRAPDGTLYYDDFAEWPSTTIGGFSYPDVSGLLAFDFGFQPVSGGLAVPSTSAALERVRAAGELQPGTWRFTVNDWANACPFSGCTGGNGAGRYRVHVVKRPTALPGPGEGTLDVEVYLATDDSSELATAAIAAAHPQLARFEQSLGFFLAKAGIALGEVHFNDLDPAVKERYAPAGQVDVSATDPCSDLAQLFTSAIVPKRAVHLFLADALVAPSIGAGFRIAGVDGSIPGPSGFPGTIYGGTIVGVEDLGFERKPGACEESGDPSLATCGTDDLAYITAHEIGHWLGLFHTTEQDGTLFDPVSDTPRCPCRSCAPQGQLAGCAENGDTSSTTLVTNDRCVASESCGGGRNLMFWLLDDGDYPSRDAVSTGELSPDQAQLMRLNPVVR
jgi:hypothetical protein